MTLNKLVFGAQAPWKRDNAEPENALNKAVRVELDVQQDGHSATNWQPVQVETSDATGKRVTGWVNTQNQDGDPETLPQWGLWPDEPAWKVRVEFSRVSGFTEGELWTVQNVPVEAESRCKIFWNYGRRQTNSAFAETTLDNIHLKLFPAKQFTDQSPRSQPLGAVQIQISKPLVGMRMTLLNATDDQVYDIQKWNWSLGGNYYSFAFRELGGTKTSQSHVRPSSKPLLSEFMAKPAKQ